MADVQQEHGHIRIANDLWEAMTRAPLKGAEYRVLMAIIRLTWGWRQKSARLTNKQIGDLCDISDMGYVSRLTKSLVTKGLLSKSANWGRAGAEYAMNKDWESWNIDAGVSTDQEVNLDAEVNIESPNIDQEVSTDIDAGVSTDIDLPVKVPSVIYNHEENHVQNHHPLVRNTVIGTLDPPQNARAPDDEDPLYRDFLDLWMPSYPKEFDRDEFRLLVAEHGPDKIRKWLDAAGETKTCRRERVMPWLHRCAENDSKGGVCNGGINPGEGSNWR